MRELLAALAIGALSFVALPAQAASLTLGCSGTVVTGKIPKVGVAPDEGKDNVSDYSVVVDLDRRAVFGFWFEIGQEGLGGGGVHTALPITQTDANTVTFEARRKQGALDRYITGSVDRITGAVSAYDSFSFPDGSTTVQSWDLHCKPTRPLF